MKTKIDHIFKCIYDWEGQNNHSKTLNESILDAVDEYNEQYSIFALEYLYKAEYEDALLRIKELEEELNHHNESYDMIIEFRKNQ